MYRILTVEKFMFSDKKLSKLLEFYYLEPCLSTSITAIVEAINTVFQEKDSHSEIYVTVEVCRRTQKSEIYLANEGSGSAFFSTHLGHIFRSNVDKENGLMLSWKHVKNQNMFRTLSLSWYKLTWLKTIWLATRRPLCWVVFFSFQTSRLETIYLLDNKQAVRRLATCSLDRCSKILSIVFILAWETREVKKTLCKCRYHSSCFDV